MGNGLRPGRAAALWLLGQTVGIGGSYVLAFGPPRLGVSILFLGGVVVAGLATLWLMRTLRVAIALTLSLVLFGALGSTWAVVMKRMEDATPHLRLLLQIKATDYRPGEKVNDAIWRGGYKEFEFLVSNDSNTQIAELWIDLDMPQVLVPGGSKVTEHILTDGNPTLILKPTTVTRTTLKHAALLSALVERTVTPLDEPVTVQLTALTNQLILGTTKLLPGGAIVVSIITVGHPPRALEGEKYTGELIVKRHHEYFGRSVADIMEGGLIKSQCRLEENCIDVPLTPAPNGFARRLIPPAEVSDWEGSSGPFSAEWSATSD